MYSNDLIKRLENKSFNLRKTILEMVYKAQSGHLGGSLSAVEIAVCLFYQLMKVYPENPQWIDRDRFILSKGHAAPLLYAILADKGFFAEEELNNFRQLNSILQGHPDKNKTPGIDMTTGSLGQGLSIGIGLAVAANLNQQDYYVYVLMGDGELNEGQIWEAAMFASKYKLNNLIAIVDKNGVQLDGTCNTIMPLEPLSKKWEAFGWNVLETDGHDIESLLKTLEQAKDETAGPVVVMADTIKGKGVSFMENDHNWHGQSPSTAQFEQAIVEINRGCLK